MKRLFHSLFIYKIFFKNNLKVRRKMYHKNIFFTKELSFCQKLRFSSPYIMETRCRRPYLFQSMNSSRSNNLSLKYYKRLHHQTGKIWGLKYLSLRLNSFQHYMHMFFFKDFRAVAYKINKNCKS